MEKSNLAILIVFMLAIGCNSGSDSGNATTAPEPIEEAAPPVQEDAASSSQPENPPHGEPGHIHNEGTPADTGTGTTQEGVTLNPPHGEPGHRCDIAVGAPLP